MKMHWSIPEEKIKTVECIYCEETGDTKWAEQHLKDRKYYLLISADKKRIDRKFGIQFMVKETY